MASEWDWVSGEGLLGLDDPAAWDAAFERGAHHLGTAAIGLAFQCPLEEASPRIVKAVQLLDPEQRTYGFTAVGTAARVHQKLTPELYAALRTEGHNGLAVFAIDDTLASVPFRNLPLWLKRRKITSAIRNKLESWWVRSQNAVMDTWQVVRKRRH